MQGSSLFLGHMPTILCVAGVSLGSEKTFHNKEMVNAIWALLGILVLNKKHIKKQDTNTLWDYNNDQIGPYKHIPRQNIHCSLPNILIDVYDIEFSHTQL